MDEEKDNSLEFYLAELDKLIENKKKENKYLKTIANVITKNNEDITKSSNNQSKRKNRKNL